MPSSFPWAWTFLTSLLLMVLLYLVHHMFHKPYPKNCPLRGAAFLRSEKSQHPMRDGTPSVNEKIICLHASCELFSPGCFS